MQFKVPRWTPPKGRRRLGYTSIKYSNGVKFNCIPNGRNLKPPYKNVIVYKHRPMRRKV